MRSNHLPLALALMTVLLVPSAACKEGNPISGGISPATADFVAEERDPAVTERYVWLRINSRNEGRIVLDVVVSEVDEPVTGIAMKLTYPDSFSKFINCADGDLFPPGQCYSSEPAPGSGEVFISRSVMGLSQATTVSGDQVIARIQFLVFGVDQGAISIEGQNLGGGDASALLDLDGDPIFVDWYSGTLVGE